MALPKKLVWALLGPEFGSCNHYLDRDMTRRYPAHIDTRSTPVKEQDGEDPAAARLCHLRGGPVDVQHRSVHAVMSRTVAVPGLQMAAGPMPRDSHTARSLQTSTQNVKFPCAS